jgi:hypothetical protein
MQGAPDRSHDAILKRQGLSVLRRTRRPGYVRGLRRAGLPDGEWQLLALNGRSRCRLMSATGVSSEVSFGPMRREQCYPGVYVSVFREPAPW